MIDHQARIRNVVKDELKKVSLGQIVGYAVSPTVIPVMTQQGPQPKPGWMVMISLRTTNLGYPEVMQSELLVGGMPPEDSFRESVGNLFQKCVAIRTQIEAQDREALAQFRGSINGS